VVLRLAALKESECDHIDVLGGWNGPRHRHLSVSCRNRPAAARALTEKHLSSLLVWRLVEFYAPPEDGLEAQRADPARRYEGILLMPRSPAKDAAGLRPLIVVPHGGPHSVTTTQYLPAYAYLAIKLDAAVLHVNYRGSSGFGQGSVDSLLGRIGERLSVCVSECVPFFACVIAAALIIVLV
jgi:hypothetical protein